MSESTKLHAKEVTVAALPVIGVYSIVVIYHVMSAVFRELIPKEVLSAKPDINRNIVLFFMAALILSTVVWLVALLYYIFNGSFGLSNTKWKNRVTLIMIIVFAWCVLQPIVTTATLPQLMSLLDLRETQGDDSEAKRFITLFQWTRLPGFALGLSVAFSFSFLLLSLPANRVADHHRRVRKRLLWGFVLFVLIVVMGLIRLLVAQYSIDFGDKIANVVTSVRYQEFVIYVSYYGMMGLVGCACAMISFNQLTENESLCFGRMAKIGVSAGAVCGPALTLLVDRVLSSLMK